MAPRPGPFCLIGATIGARLLTVVWLGRLFVYESRPREPSSKPPKFDRKELCGLVLIFPVKAPLRLTWTGDGP